MDVSGTLTMSPNKDQFVADFFNSLLGPMDTSTQVDLGIVSFSDTAVVDLPPGHYTTTEVWDAVDNVHWVGGNTNITGGVVLGASQMNTDDDVTDILIVISDGFDSFSMSDAVAAANSAGADGITIISIAFGNNNFYSLFTMSQIANMESENLFTAGSNEDLAGLPPDILDQLCAVTGAQRTILFDPATNEIAMRSKLIASIARFVDANGIPPKWAAVIDPDDL